MPKFIKRLLKSINGDWIQFKPKEDITAYELSLILPYLITKSMPNIQDIPDTVLRHFEKMNTPLKEQEVSWTQN
jgi:hypothetical protein